MAARKKPAPEPKAATATAAAETAPVDEKASPQEQPGAQAGAAPAAAASAEPPADPAGDFEPGEFFVRVTGPRKGRWRAGRQFGREPVFIDAAELTPEARDAIYDDPMLSAEVVSAEQRDEEEAPPAED